MLISIDLRRDLALALASGSLLFVSCAPVPPVVAERAAPVTPPASRPAPGSPPPSASIVAADAPRPMAPMEDALNDELVGPGPAPGVTSELVKVSAGGAPAAVFEEWVSDCNGGKVRAPLWLTRVPVWAALCVQAPAKVRVNIDVGTNLVAHEGLSNGDAVSFFQVYYSLSKVRVMPNEKQVVWAVCGGGGINLQHGDRVVPASVLPSATAGMLVRHVSQLIQINTERDKFERLFRNSTDPTDKKDLNVVVDQLDLALTDAGGLLRAALIKENHLALGQPGAAPPPLWPPKGKVLRGVPAPKVHLPKPAPPKPKLPNPR